MGKLEEVNLNLGWGIPWYLCFCAELNSVLYIHAVAEALAYLFLVSHILHETLHRCMYNTCTVFSAALY